MKRLHVHVAVDDLAASIRFYSTMFASEPTVQKADYAKWMLDDPRVNFAISARGTPPGLNHLGVQVENAGELAEMNARLQTLEADVVEEMGTACCYARSDKYWATDPAGIAWETYHTLDSIPVFGAAEEEAARTGGCCVPEPAVAEVSGCMPVKGKPAGCC
ncbi:MAG: glyoxalase/bleomycin resistance/dioxygenase family protein [Thiobacillus sp. 65-69]|nr:glyoxalase/bleomycin resistance/dioxygenase family protein [Thiobacillus sp.]ODU87569.1 MAG: glyoxalase [Thiobacillus sp. SCN 65-179]OJW38681.1 MAG: glyoxalase/bleomycin resistance/dioxygenase family protein [Thiobacillus sp. 65-69]